MILLASDHVGLCVTEYLVSHTAPIDWLVLDAADRGGCNAAIERAFARSTHRGRVEAHAALTDDRFLREVKTTSPLIGVLAWWPHLIKSPLLEIPTRGWLNLHPGYLPYNRGKHPNFWCLLEETPCGASLHVIDGGVDTGPVVARARVDTTWEDTGETVYRRCRDLAVDLFIRNFADFAAGRAEPVPQVPSAGTSHRAAAIDGASEIVLDRTYTARSLLNLIRARMFPPHPTAYFRDGGKKFSVRVIIQEVDA